MAVASVVIEIQEGMSEAVLHRLADLDRVSVYGVKDNQIVAVIDGDDLSIVEDTIKELYVLEDVVGVYPVFAGDYE
ncbi:MAG: chaperone NapD [Nitrospirota bacterium]